MRDQIESLQLGLEVAHDQATFWEKKARESDLELKILQKKLEILNSVEQELDTYKEKVGELAK